MAANITEGYHKLSSPANEASGDGVDIDGIDVPDENIRLMYLANEGDLEAMKELLDDGVDVNFRDIDRRTALHVAACQGSVEVVKLLLDKGAEVDPEDQWGSTPLSDAIHYKNSEVIKLLEKHGAKLKIVPMHVNHARDVPEYEIDPKEIDFRESIKISKGTFRRATWRGIQVAVKQFGDDVIIDDEKVRAFRDELELLQQVRHPNVVQFLGAVTQSSPMMIVTEYLPKGDLREYLNRKKALKPFVAVKFALDIARGMAYLHNHKPEAIIHRDLEPSNILRDDSGHLKVADFGISKMLKVTKTVKENAPPNYLDNCRYVAPEVFRNEEYDMKVDVFSFALILQEMIEGRKPFSSFEEDNEVPKAYAGKERPPFSAHKKLYAHGLKELIEDCWRENPADRPPFEEIIERLLNIYRILMAKQRWKALPLKCFHSIGTIWKKADSDHNRSTLTHSASSNF